MKTPKKNIIEVFIESGLFDAEDISQVDQLLAAAGRLLDHACSHDICGAPVFKCADGKWYTGSVEFSVYPANPAFLVDVLTDEKAECDNCGHIERIDDLDEMSDLKQRLDDHPKHVPAGDCTKCGAFSYRITSERAKEIAGITKKKPARRRGGLK